MQVALAFFRYSRHNLQQHKFMHTRPFVIRYSSFVILLTLLTSWGCQKKSTHLKTPRGKLPATTQTNSPPAAVTPPLVEAPKTAPLEPAPLPKTITTPSSFELGEMDFQVGNYKQAAQSYETFLSSNRESKDRAEALFHLGWSRVLADDSSRDLRQAEVHFQRLIAEFPDSRFRKQAEFILGLLNQIDKLRADVKERDDKIKRLGEELQKLKDIDLSRKPSRPPN
jgi:tetratricopeptide (TPR) repeat protein